MALSNWPTIVDDDGSLTLGTVINKSVFDAIKASVEADLFSAVNPAVTAENIIDEVVTARGSKASLDARLDVVLNEDGTLKAQANLVSDSELTGSIGHGNWVHNDDFMIWAAGDAVAPTAWTLGTIACARTGVGLADTTTKVGLYSAKLTRAGASGTLEQNVVGTGSMGSGGVYLRGRTMAFGCWVWAAAASIIKIYLSDGVGSTDAEDSSGNVYHPGDSTWIWFSGTHTVSLGATKITIGAALDSADGSGYISGATVIPSAVAPSAWIPCQKRIEDVSLHLSGTLATGTNKMAWASSRPFLISSVWGRVVTPPVGANIIIDINHWDGAVHQTMFAGAGKLTLTPTEGKNSVVIDGTYRYRCFEPSFSGLEVIDKVVFVDIDQVGSSTAGAELGITLRLLKYNRPQESFLAWDDWR